ncbi:OAR domain-containing protein [Caerostris extrusa]|uniref:OAR domain-containing protein n=1 Tax=Caerostris extrusa TaxID=172846 RepID=A0AAV4XEM5_CAEEX|nr:OAR domain-containing protein [Caerostris extrusa]
MAKLDCPLRERILSFWPASICELDRLVVFAVCWVVLPSISITVILNVISHSPRNLDSPPLTFAFGPNSLSSDLMMATSTPIESSRIAPYINVSSAMARLPQERYLVPGAHYLPYADPAFIAAAQHYAAAAAAAAVANTTTGGGASTGPTTTGPAPHHSFLFYPTPTHPFSLSALMAAERLNNKNSSIADLRLKSSKTCSGPWIVIMAMSGCYFCVYNYSEG